MARYGGSIRTIDRKERDNDQKKQQHKGLERQDRGISVCRRGRGGSVSPHQPSEVARAGVFRAYDGDVVACQHVHLPRGRTPVGLLASVASPQRLGYIYRKEMIIERVVTVALAEGEEVCHLYERGCGWNLTVKMLLPLFLLDFKSKTRSQNALHTEEDSSNNRLPQNT